MMEAENMDGLDLMNELNEKVNMLNQALSAYRKRGTEFAAARKDYQVSLSKEILIQRDAGLPVTIILDTCKGNPVIADLRLKKDIADAMYKSASEAINGLKLQIRIIEGQIEREWGRR